MLKSKLNKKAVILSIIGLLGAGVLTSNIIYGYLTAKDELIDEDISFGNVNIEINENYDPTILYVPGGSVTKEPWVTNIGDQPCYVRIRADINDGLFAQNVSIDFDTEHWTKKQPDGYYYYKGYLTPCTCDRTDEGYDSTQDCLNNKHRTENLFNSVSIADIDDDEITNFYIYIYAEAIPIESKTDLYSSPNEGWSLYCNRTADNPIVIEDESFDFSARDNTNG